MWLMWMSKKSIAIFGYKQWLLSLEMKTKVDQHVPRINLRYFKFQIFKIFQIFSGSQLLSDFQTFFYLQINFPWYIMDRPNKKIWQKVKVPIMWICHEFSTQLSKLLRLSSECHKDSMPVIMSLCQNIRVSV